MNEPVSVIAPSNWLSVIPSDCSAVTNVSANSGVENTFLRLLLPLTEYEHCTLEVPFDLYDI